MAAPVPQFDRNTGAMSDALTAIDIELFSLAQSADHLQTAIGELVRIAGRQADGRVLQDVQMLDPLVQRLFALAECTSAMSDALERTGRIDPAIMAEWRASRRVRTPEEAILDGTEAGDIEMF